MKLSIITINKDNSAGLEKTIQSVTEQTFNDFEYIVIDGKSSDNSVDVIKIYIKKITYWISEQDAGIYNAINKGIRIANGDYCLFLNSGDYLINNNTLNDVFEIIKKLPEADIYYSDCLKDTNEIQYFPKTMDMAFLVYRPISHQNTLIKRSLFIQHGFYNENLTIASDWEFWLNEIWKYKSNYIYLPIKISVFDTNGIGSKMSDIQKNENIIIYKNVFHDLSDILIDYKDYYNSIYRDIVKSFGLPPSLKFILRIYRYFLKKIKKQNLWTK
jgi:glycosyltransferase involved in cell wall biosynthesis